MIVIQIGKEKYKLPESRKDISIRQMLQYHERVEPHMPDSMKRIAAYYKDLGRVNGRDVPEEIKQERQKQLEAELNEDLQALVKDEKPETYYLYYAKVLSFFSGAPEDVLKRVRVKDLEKWHGILLRLINEQEPDPEFTGFEFGGVRYNLPQRLPVPMEDATLIEFLEAEQYKHYYAKLMEATGKDELGFDVKSHYNALPIVCILCRKETEPYSDNLVKERSQLFLDLPVYYADQVFFYLVRWKVISTKITDRLSEIGSNLKTSPQGQEN